jgi:hypothetical protein
MSSDIDKRKQLGSMTNYYNNLSSRILSEIT